MVLLSFITIRMRLASCFMQQLEVALGPIFLLLISLTSMLDLRRIHLDQCLRIKLHEALLLIMDHPRVELNSCLHWNSFYFCTCPYLQVHHHVSIILS